LARKAVLSLSDSSAFSFALTSSFSAIFRSVISLATPTKATGLPFSSFTTAVDKEIGN
jgi:hypothetical protein